VDNISGRAGIGDKGAKDLITRFRVGGRGAGARGRGGEADISGELAEPSRQILLSKQLATIHTDVPVPFVLDL